MQVRMPGVRRVAPARPDFSCIAAGNFCCSCKFTCRVCGAWRRRGGAAGFSPVSRPATFVVHASSRAGCAARGAGAAGRPDFFLFRVRRNPDGRQAPPTRATCICNQSCRTRSANLPAAQRARPAQLVSATKVAGRETRICRPPARPPRATCICKQSCRTRDANLPAAERARPAQLVSATKVAGSGTQIFRAPAPPTRATCICNRLGAANVPAATRRG